MSLLSNDFLCQNKIGANLSLNRIDGKVAKKLEAYKEQTVCDNLKVFANVDSVDGKEEDNVHEALKNCYNKSSVRA